MMGNILIDDVGVVDILKGLGLELGLAEPLPLVVAWIIGRTWRWRLPPGLHYASVVYPVLL